MKRILFSLAMTLAAVFGLCMTAQAAYEPGTVGKSNVLSGNLRTIAVIDGDNTLWMWGDWEYGILGTGNIKYDPNSDTVQKTPVKVMENVRSVTLGGLDGTPIAAAIKTDGSLWMWGYNEDGYLGKHSTEIKYEDRYKNIRTIQPVPAKVMDNVAAVSCNTGNFAAIKTDGSLWVWGDNYCGQVGNGSYGGKQTTPVKVLDNVASVSCGALNTAAVKTDGSLWMWGRVWNNSLNYGGTGNAGSNGWQTAPVKTMDGVAEAYYGGGSIPYVLKTDGTLVIWQATQGTELPTEPLPLRVIAQDVASVSNTGAGIGVSTSTAILKRDNSLWMYGYNLYGQLGNESVFKREDYIEEPVKAMANVSAVTICDTNIFAITSDGVLWAWGPKDDVTMAVAPDAPGTSYTFRNYYDSLGRKVTVNCVVTPYPIPSGVPTMRTSAARPASTVGGFADVSRSSSFADAILWAVKKNITTGKTATTFAPGENCTKGQILTFLWRAYDSPEPTTENPFTDSIPASFQKAAVWAYEKGLVSGGVFGADTPCTRAMTVEYLWKAAGSPATSKNAGFTDVPANADYAPAIAWAVENGVTSGTGNGQFSPASTCTRGQIVTFLYRCLAGQQASGGSSQQQMGVSSSLLNSLTEEERTLARITAYGKTARGERPLQWDEKGQPYVEILEEDYRDAMGKRTVTDEQQQAFEEVINSVALPEKAPNSEVTVDPDGTMHYIDVDGNSVTVPPDESTKGKTKEELDAEYDAIMEEIRRVAAGLT